MNVTRRFYCFGVVILMRLRTFMYSCVDLIIMCFGPIKSFQNIFFKHHLLDKLFFQFHYLNTFLSFLVGLRLVHSHTFAQSLCVDSTDFCLLPGRMFFFREMSNVPRTYGVHLLSFAKIRNCTRFRRTKLDVNHWEQTDDIFRIWRSDFQPYCAAIRSIFASHQFGDIVFLLSSIHVSILYNFFQSGNCDRSDEIRFFLYFLSYLMMGGCKKSLKFFLLH